MMKKSRRGTHYICPFPNCEFKATTWLDFQNHMAQHKEALEIKPASEIKKAKKRKRPKRVVTTFKKVAEELKTITRMKEAKFPPTWKPSKEGEMIIGQIIEIREPYVYNEARPLVEIEDEEGKRWSIWFTPIVLKRIYTEGWLEVGDIIAIKYLGRKGKRGWMDFAVAIHDKDGKLKLMR